MPKADDFILYNTLQKVEKNILRKCFKSYIYIFECRVQLMWSYSEVLGSGIFILLIT